MKNFEDQIINSLVSAFKTLFEADIEKEKITLQPTNKEFKGTHTFVVFPYLKITRKTPEESAKAIGVFLVENCDSVTSFNVVKGFLNLELSTETWINSFHKLGELKPSAKKGSKYIVEYASPNTNKPLHLGHLRNIFLGFSVNRILQEAGSEVVKTQIVNDRGIHICKSMLAWKRYGNEENPESSGLKGDKLVGKYYVLFDVHYKEEIAQLIKEGLSEEEAKKEAPILKEAQELLRKWESKDAETYTLWEKMNGWVYDGFDATYESIGVDFDKNYYESDTYLLGKGIVDAGLEKGVFYKKDDGSVWIDLTSEGLDEKLILRSDGTAVYMTQDIGTANQRYLDFPGIDGMIYTVGNEQDYHFKVLFLILKKLGYSWGDGCHHLSYGMVDLPTGKMKSREGTVVDADDIISEMINTAEERTKELGKIEGLSEEGASSLYRIIGLGALKYFLLKVDPKKRMMFNPKESIDFQGNTGPFIQYTYARISAILRRAKILELEDSSVSDNLSLHNSEIDLISLVSAYSERVDLAANEYSSSIIAQYVYDLAKAYNRFYTELSIFGAENKEEIKFRVQLSEQVAKAIKKSMYLLGIEVPERM
ncbi:MAG: arginine--tRNA ligase [Bacteroidota bacterium]